MKPAAVAALCAFALAGCGTPQSLPVSIPRCDAVRTAKGITLNALVASHASKPITALSVSVDFYHDFRTATVQGYTEIRPELGPGAQRTVVFKIPAAPAQAQGSALRCLATHIGYADGTSQDMPPAK